MRNKLRCSIQLAVLNGRPSGHVPQTKPDDWLSSGVLLTVIMLGLWDKPRGFTI